MSGPTITSDQSSNSPDLNGLKIGTRISEFEVVSRLGEGGFSVVYLALDHSLERNVALKEYMPMSIASRVDNTQIAPMTERHRETFDVALASFINEGKLLAQFDHPALVKVYRFWEANGTAYMVMPFYEGRTLRDTIRDLDQPPDEEWFVSMLQPLTQALSVIHAANCYHRDIAPDNVMLLSGSGKPLLLDFGAARRVVGDRTQALTAILKPGYAPIEQYAEVPHLRQGAWTDVYALAAVMYWAIKGTTPPSSVGRMLKDSYVPLVESAADRYSQRFLQAIDNALKVLPEDRTQNIDAFRQDMGLAQPKPERQVSILVDSEKTILRPSTQRAPAPPADATVFSAIPGSRPTTTTGLPETPAAQAVEAAAPAASPAVAEPGGITAFMASPKPPPVAAADEAAPVSAPVAAKRPAPMMLAMGATGLVVIAGAAWWWLQQPQPVNPSPSAVDIATAPTTPSAQPTPAPPPIEEPVVAALPAPPPVSIPAPVVKIEVRPPIEVETAGLRSPFELGKKPLEFAVTVNAAGFLYVFGRHEKDGQLQLLLPDKKSAAIELVAGKSQQVDVPVKTLATQPPGEWQLWVLASRTRQELNAADWSKQGARIKAKFDPAAAADGQYWVELLCPAKTECESEYGIRKLALATEAVPRPAPKPVVAAPRVVSKPAPEPKPEPVRAAATSPPPAPAAQPAECARLIQRMSLGAGGVELVKRMQALGCR